MLKSEPYNPSFARVSAPQKREYKPSNSGPKLYLCFPSQTHPTPEQVKEVEQAASVRAHLGVQRGDSGDRVLEISGARNGLAHACAIVLRTTNQNTLRFCFPASQRGCVIGRGGENLSQLPSSLIVKVEREHREFGLGWASNILRITGNDVNSAIDYAVGLMIHATSNKDGAGGSSHPNKRRHTDSGPSKGHYGGSGRSSGSSNYNSAGNYNSGNSGYSGGGYGHGSSSGGYSQPYPSNNNNYRQNYSPYQQSNPGYGGYNYDQRGGQSGYGPSPHALAGNGAPPSGYGRPAYQQSYGNHQFTLQGVVEEYRALVSEFARPNMGSSFVVLLVEYNSVGAIVGRGGEIVTKLQKELNCKINIAKNKGDYRVVCLGGVAENIANTCYEIAKRTAEKQVSELQELIFCLPPSGQHGNYREGNQRFVTSIEGKRVEGYRFKGTEEQIKQKVTKETIGVFQYISDLLYR